MYLQTFEICLEIYELDTVHVLTAPRLVWQATLKKTRVKFVLLTDAEMLLMAEKGIRGGTFHAIHWYAKANKKIHEELHEK